MIDGWLYPGAQVDFTLVQYRRTFAYARLISFYKGKAAVAVWRQQCRRHEIKILPADCLRLSQNPTEAPPLPLWATNPPIGPEFKRRNVSEPKY